MRKCSFAFLLLSVCSLAQTPLPDEPKEAVIAEINGRKITLAEYKRMLEAQDQNMKSLAQRQPKAFLEEYALYETVLAAAEKAGLDKQSPFKEKIAMSRRQILAAGMVDETHRNFPVPVETARKFYGENPDMYTQAVVKVIFVSKALQMGSLSPDQPTRTVGPEESLAKAEKAAKAVREGADFAKIAAEYSDDPNSASKGADFPHPIRRTSREVPVEIRTPVLAAKEGEIVGPLEHVTGYYIFKIVSNGQASFDQVKDDIVRELKDAGLKHWLAEVRKVSSVTIQDEALLLEAAKAK